LAAGFALAGECALAGLEALPTMCVAVSPSGEKATQPGGGVSVCG
jgi:hypothetical protein